VNEQDAIKHADVVAEGLAAAGFGMHPHATETQYALVKLAESLSRAHAEVEWLKRKLNDALVRANPDVACVPVDIAVSTLESIRQAVRSFRMHSKMHADLGTEYCNGVAYGYSEAAAEVAHILEHYEADAMMEGDE